MANALDRVSGNQFSSCGEASNTLCGLGQIQISGFQFPYLSNEIDWLWWTLSSEMPWSDSSPQTLELVRETPALSRGPIQIWLSFLRWWKYWTQLWPEGTFKWNSQLCKGSIQIRTHPNVRGCRNWTEKTCGWSQSEWKATAEVIHVVKPRGSEGNIKKKGALEIGSFAQTEMDMESVTENEVGQKERKKISYINACTWDLEKWCRWASFQGTERDADAENGHADVGDGEAWNESD